MTKHIGGCPPGSTSFSRTVLPHLLTLRLIRRDCMDAVDRLIVVTLLLATTAGVIWLLTL